MTEALGRATTTATAIYLVRTGWTRIGGRNAGTVWSRPCDGGVSHLFQPEAPTGPDYALRMGEMVAALAVVEDRAELAILADLGGVVHAGQPAEPERRAAGRTGWMEPDYGLRQPELERLQWPLSQAAELADLVAECELTAAESARAEERRDG